MSYVCALHETPQTKDLRVAIDRFLDLWARADVTTKTSVHLFIQTTHRAVAHTVAQLLSPDTRGFASIENSGENRTAAEILADGRSDRNPTWHGSFANDVAPDLICPLLLRLRNLAADPLRRTSLNLHVRNIRWHAAPAQSRGAIVLTDHKIFQRKVRFRFDLGYETRDDLSKRDLQTDLKAVAEVAGIDFRAGDCVCQVRSGEWTTEQKAVASLLFSEVTERVSQSLLHDQFDWSRLPGVFADRKGVQRRFTALAEGPKESFRWEADVTTFMRAWLPGFRAKNGIFADTKTYIAPFEGPWWIAVIFDTHPGLRIGRVFKLRCGILAIEDKEVRFKRSSPVLRCSGGSYHESHDTCPEFSFNTHAELTAIFEGLSRFLPDFLIRFRGQLKKVLLPAWPDIADVFPTLRELTARAALEMAADLLQQAAVATQLVGASLHALPHVLVYRQDPAAELPPTGRSGLIYQWSVTYVAGGTLFEVFIPSAGSPRFSRTEINGLELNPHLAPAPIPAPEIDSDEAARRMHEKRDALRPRYPAMNPIIGSLQLKQLDGRPVWTAQIEFSPREPERRDWVLVTPAFDAMTGELIQVEFDERFPDAAQTQRTFTER